MRGTTDYTSYYGHKTITVYSDSDFDIGDTYSIAGNYTVESFLHSHGTAKISQHDGTNYVDLTSQEDTVIQPVAGKFMKCSVASEGSTAVAGSLRIGDSGLDNTLLVVVMSYSLKVAG